MGVACLFSRRGRNMRKRSILNDAERSPATSIGKVELSSWVKGGRTVRRKRRFQR